MDIGTIYEPLIKLPGNEGTSVQLLTSDPSKFEGEYPGFAILWILSSEKLFVMTRQLLEKLKSARTTVLSQ